MKNKLRSLTALLAVVLCASVFSIPAYAQSSEPQTEQAAEETAEPEQATPNPFTPKGTGTVLDNATSEDEKEFYTIVTPDENVFYLVDTTTAQPVEPEPQPTVTPQPEEPVTEEPKEPEQPQTQGTSPLMMVLIGVAVLAVGGLGYYFKIYKPKHELDDAADLDEFEFEGPQEETVREEDLESTELTAEEEAEQRRLYEEEQDEPEEMDDGPVQ